MSSIDVIIFLISVQWGAMGVATAYSLSRPILWLPRILYCYRGTPLKFTELISTLSLPSIASLVTEALLMAINYLLPSEINLLLGLSLNCIFYGLVYVAILLALPNGKQTLWEMMQMLKEFKKNESG